jgi:hypothetical protein
MELDSSGGPGVVAGAGYPTAASAAPDPPAATMDLDVDGGDEGESVDDLAVVAAFLAPDPAAAPANARSDRVARSVVSRMVVRSRRHSAA